MCHAMGINVWSTRNLSLLSFSLGMGSWRVEIDFPVSGVLIDAVHEWETANHECRLEIPRRWVVRRSGCRVRWCLRLWCSKARDKWPVSHSIHISSTDMLRSILSVIAAFDLDKLAFQCRQREDHFAKRQLSWYSLLVDYLSQVIDQWTAACCHVRRNMAQDSAHAIRYFFGNGCLSSWSCSWTSESARNFLVY